MTFTLTYLDRQRIENAAVGLNEPSGLALADDGKGLWTVSDKTKRVFRLDLDGTLRKADSFKVKHKGLEGITGDDSGRFLFTVREGTNEVIKLDIAGRKSVQVQPIAAMSGYDAVKGYFIDDSDDNKGLEGITWNRDTGTLFVLKEGDPGLFIEISSDLASILDHTRLGPENGFIDPRANPKKVDYSGICYDPGRRAFWIVSDKAQRLYLYSHAEDRVIHSAALGYVKNGTFRGIRKAEGVALDPATSRLYVVCDETARLYVYDVRS